MKQAFLFCVALLLCRIITAQGADNKVIFNGTVSGDTKGFNKIYYYSETNPYPDSVTIIDGKFSFAVPFKSRYTQLFYTQYEMKVHGGMKPFQVLVDRPGTITIDNMNIGKGFLTAAISGSKTTETFHSFLQNQEAVFKEADRKAGETRETVIKDMMGKLITDLAKSNRDDFVATYIMNGYAKSFLNADQLEKAYSYLSPAIKNSDEGKRLATFISGLKNASPGYTVANFVLPDVQDRPFNFTELRGKYVWIDFWTSWCGPCRQAFPHMRKLYAKYKDKNFEILGISADVKKAPWLKALNDVKNPWLQVWDDKAVTDQFGVTSYPTSFLISPSGKILVKEIGYDPGEKGVIEKELEKIFAVQATGNK